jgi:hypothetical protein
VGVSYLILDASILSEVKREFVFRKYVLLQRNGTIDPHVVTVKRGIKNVMDVGKVIAIDGKTEQDIWTGTCNEFQGTDGTVFPPFLTEKDNLESFSTDLCRFGLLRIFLLLDFLTGRDNQLLFSDIDTHKPPSSLVTCPRTC